MMLLCISANSWKKYGCFAQCGYNTLYAAWDMNFCTGKLYAILIPAHDGKCTVR